MNTQKLKEGAVGLATAPGVGNGADKVVGKTTKDKVSTEGEIVKGIIMGGEIVLSGPDFLNQTAILNMDDLDDLGIELRKSKKTTSHVDLYFRLSNLDIQIFTPVHDKDTDVVDSFYFTIRTPNGERIGLTFSIDQAATLNHILQNYVEAYSAQVELGREYIIKAAPSNGGNDGQ